MSDPAQGSALFILQGTLGPGVPVAARGILPPCGPAAAAWLTELARALRDHSHRYGALSARGGRCAAFLEGDGASLRLEWHETGAPDGHLGLATLPDGAPGGVRVRRLVQAGTLVLVLDLPPGALQG